MKYTVSHTTTYNYSTDVHQSYHLLHLSPRSVPGQTVLSHRIKTSPVSSGDFDGIDFFGNNFRILTIETEHNELVVEARSEVTVTSDPPTPEAIQEASNWEVLNGGQAGGRTFGETGGKEVQQFMAASRHGRRIAELRDYAATSFIQGRSVLAGAQDLMRRIFEDFKFDPSATDISTPVEKVFSQRRGVCQDFAHLMISSLRSLGLPARYVSGYILTHPPAGQPRLQGADASHAWVSVWAPETGWVDFDPTNNVIPHGEHITIAYGRDYDDVCPISGVLLGGAAHTVQVAVDVMPTSNS